MDSSGNTYVTGSNQDYAGGFYVTEFNSSGTVIYNTTVGTGTNGFPNAIAVVGSTGEAYVAGQTYSGGTLPTSANAYQKTAKEVYPAFLVALSAAGSVSYATYLSGTTSNYTAAQGVAVDSSGDAYLTGYTDDSNFPTTTGAYQRTFPGSYVGFVTKINPAASTGPTSLVYSTMLGPGNTYLGGVAVDSSGDAYSSVTHLRAFQSPVVRSNTPEFTPPTAECM